MAVLARLKNFINNLDERDFYLYLAAFFGFFLLIMAILIYWHISRVSHWNNQLSNLKKQRTETKQLLSEYNQVELDRQKVNDILLTDTSFKIREYYDNLVNSLGLGPYKSKEPSEPQTSELESGEKERTLVADFHSLNMKQVTDILENIENNPRVYTKKLHIDKVSKERPTLNVSIDIATIEPSNAER